MWCIYSIIFTASLLLFFHPPVSAIREIRVRSFPIHGPQDFYGNPHLNNIYYYTYSGIPDYKNGKVMLSGSEDGTAPVTFSHVIELYGTYPSGGSFRYAPGCGQNEMPPLDISQFITGNDRKSLLIRYKKELCSSYDTRNGSVVEHTSVGPLYLVAFEDTADAPEPFLRLPWDYESKGLSFYDVAFNINSYFDHEYPLLSTWNVKELPEDSNSLVTFEGIEGSVDDGYYYSSHDGYDWGKAASAFNGESVLAAASGTATYSQGSAQGNAISIDHHNGYQTRYYHLQDDGLVTTATTEVVKGQPIGRIGTTGRSDGPHIHFMVIHDKNGDGNFEDNIPDGLVDPFGWHAYSADPWEEYSFIQNGEEKTGSRSFYLWAHPFQKLQTTLKPDGNTFSLNRYQLTFPKGIVDEDAIIEAYLKPAPADNDGHSIGNAIEIRVHDGFGNLIDSFSKAWQLVISFSSFDISRYKQDTLSIFSRSTGATEWQEEESLVNIDTKIASAMIDHLSEFTIRGEKLDAIPPVTVASVSGELLQENLYVATSKVTITLSATDEPTSESLGIDFILYQINDGEWTEYEKPIELTDVGMYTMSYYAQDVDLNREVTQTIQVEIVTPPTPTPTPSPTPTNTPTPTLTYTPTPFPTPTPTDMREEHREKRGKKKWWKWFRKKWKKWNQNCVILNTYGCTKT